MDIPKGITEALFYLAPSILVFVTAYMLIKSFIDKEHKLKLIETKMLMQKEMLPLRLQAYERLALYLERISPNVMLINHHEPGMTVLEFQQKLLEMLRTEFEHNFSQQIYVSASTWNITRNAKEEVARLINSAAATLDSEAPSYQLSKKVFDNMLEQEDYPTHRALMAVKAEVAQLF
jgi:hypothetical protein